MFASFYLKLTEQFFLFSNLEMDYGYLSTEALVGIFGFPMQSALHDSCLCSK